MITSLLTSAIRCYQRWISPLLPAACRYETTCSNYAIEAIDLHGPLRGSWIAVRRLGRCHPWGGSGYDPVPGSPGSADPLGTGRP